MSKSRSTKEVLIAYIFDKTNSPPTEADIRKTIPDILAEKGQRLSLPTECTSLLIPKPGYYAVVYKISEKHRSKFGERCEDLPEQVFDKIIASINPKYAAYSVVFTKCGINQSENGNVKGYLFQINYLNTLLAEEYISQSDDEDSGEDEVAQSVDSITTSIIESSKGIPTSEQGEGAAGSTESDFVTENNQSSNLLKSGKLTASARGVRPKLGDIDSSDNAGSVSRSRQNSVDETVQKHSANDNDMNDSMKLQHTNDSQQPQDSTTDNILSTRKRKNVDDLKGKDDEVETNSSPAVQNTKATGGQDSRLITFGQFNYFDNSVIYGGDTTRGLRLEYSGKREYKVFGTNLRKVDLWNNILKDFKEVKIEARKSHLTASIFKDKCCKVKEKFSRKDIGFFLDEHLMNVHIIGPNTEVETHIPGVYHDLEVPIPKEYRKRRDLNGAMASGGAQNTADIRTSKKEALKEKDKCPVCFDDIDITDAGVTVLDKCKHAFCKDCIDQAFKVKPVCPTCGALYGKLTGTQPADGEMFVTESHYQHLPGYVEYGTITINYTFPDGRQGSEHPDPGKPYRGIRRTAYLPNNWEGKKVARLLKQAFDARIVFTIGRSTTTGKEGKITWNDIHHKTNTHGGPQKFGYPDPDYLTRVQGELADKGFK